jgi:hypothetical protein
MRTYNNIFWSQKMFTQQSKLGPPDPHPDPLIRGTDPRIRIRIRIRTIMSRIPNTVSEYTLNTYCTGTLK